MIIVMNLGPHRGEMNSCFKQVTGNVHAQLTSFEDKFKSFHPQMHSRLGPKSLPDSSNYLFNAFIIVRGLLPGM